LDWVFPPSCAGCDQLGERICPSCLASIEVLPPPLCPKCSQPAPSGQVCDSCQNDPPPWQECRSWAAYRGPLRSAIHRLKYRNDLGLCEPLSQHLVQLLQEQAWPVDCIVPIPLSRRRRQYRGYNQSAFLAYALALQTGLVYLPSALQRTRDTRSQVGLTAAERHRNLDGAFSARTDRISGRTVLLLDDVMTTGATLRNASRALLQAGASQVFTITLARALLEEHTSEEPVSPTPVGSQIVDVQHST
jgi:ComF family protein